VKTPNGLTASFTTAARRLWRSSARRRSAAAASSAEAVPAGGGPAGRGASGTSSSASAGVARGREAGGEVADVVGEARRREAAVASFLVTPLQVGDVAGERGRVVLEAVHGDQPDALLERRLGAGLLAEEIGRAPRRGERQCEAEQDRGGADHR
jgi:hypothetical protein